MRKPARTASSGASLRSLALLLPLALAPHATAQSWSNLGNGKGGTNGTPVLSATPLRLGNVTHFGVASARPNSVGVAVLGVSRGNLPVFGGVLVPNPAALLPITTDRSGFGMLSLSIPNDMRLLARKPVMQVLVADALASQGAAFSNAIEGTFCQQFETVEDFTTSRNLDADRSAGSWGNGTVTFAQVGGDGRHGDFDPTIGKLIQSNPPVYEWNLDYPGGFTIPKTHTQTGRDEKVTNGRFFFNKLVVPAGTTVYFVGSKAARISVRGKADIQGVLHANGASIAASAFTKALTKGEAGSRGGAMGGAGGAGGDKGDGKGQKAAFAGKAGQDVALLSGHAYANTYKGTGGKGSPQWPADGKSSSIIFSYFNVISQQANRGGGGGGFTAPGGTGGATWNDPTKIRYLAPGATPGGKGVAFPAAFPSYTNGFTHQDHYLLGGSGGGGSGSSVGGAIKTTPNNWWTAGRGGAGGGGAIGLRIGGSLVLGVNGRIDAKGGSCPFDQSNFALRGMAAPGGGGSGGSVFLQVQGSTRNQGEISTMGGLGGRVWGHVSDQVYSGMKSHGGSGSNGIVHFETAQVVTGYKTGKTVPAAPVANLDPKFDDKVVAVRSQWYATALALTPKFLRYEVHATVGGKPVVYSDDPLIGKLANGPIKFRVQGAHLSRDTNGKLVPTPNRPAPTGWGEYVGPFSTRSLNGLNLNGYRFELHLDRSYGQTVSIKKVVVRWCL